MLVLGTWLEQARALPAGRSARVNHDCGGGRTLKVSHDEDGTFRAYCHRCGEGGGHRPKPDLQALVAISKRLRFHDALLREKPGVLPEPATYDMDDWPPAARLWLYRAGIGKNEAAILGAFYHAPTDRVVLPVGRPPFGRHVAEFYQARAYQPGRFPKYLGPDYRPPELIAAYEPVIQADPRRIPVLTEDILSAFKVSLAGHTGWAVLGTSIPASYIAELLRQGRGCSLWLDPDEAGQRAAKKYIKQLRAYSIPVRNILSEKDPKLCFVEQIKELLA